MILAAWTLLGSVSLCLGFYHNAYNTPLTSRCLCGEAIDPVCGTDGRTYYNSCYLKCFNGLPYAPIGGPSLDPAPTVSIPVRPSFGVGIGPGPVRPSIGIATPIISHPIISGIGVRPYDDCRNGDGHDYDGILSITSDGQRCSKWMDHIGVYPMRTFGEDPVKSDNFPEQSVVGASNYCRNPDRDPRGPWCFTGYRDPGMYGFCTVPICAGYSYGFGLGNGEGYRPGIGPDSITITSGSIGGGGTTVGPGPGKRSISLFAEGSVGIGVSRPNGYGGYAYPSNYVPSYTPSYGGSYGYGYGYNGIATPAVGYAVGYGHGTRVEVAYEGECRGVFGSPGWGADYLGAVYCRDNPAYKHFCQDWSRNGYCARSREFMSQHCGRACNMC